MLCPEFCFLNKNGIIVLTRPLIQPNVVPDANVHWDVLADTPCWMDEHRQRSCTFYEWALHKTLQIHKKKSEMFIESVKKRLAGNVCVWGNEDTRKNRLLRAEPRWKQATHFFTWMTLPSLQFVFNFFKGKTRLETLEYPGQWGENLQGNTVPAENSSALVTRW